MEFHETLQEMIEGCRESRPRVLEKIKNCWRSSAKWYSDSLLVRRIKFNESVRLVKKDSSLSLGSQSRSTLQSCTHCRSISNRDMGSIVLRHTVPFSVVILASVAVIAFVRFEIPDLVGQSRPSRKLVFMLTPDMDKETQILLVSVTWTRTGNVRDGGVRCHVQFKTAPAGHSVTLTNSSSTPLEISTPTKSTSSESNSLALSQDSSQNLKFGGTVNISDIATSPSVFATLLGPVVVIHLFYFLYLLFCNEIDNMMAGCTGEENPEDTEDSHGVECVDFENLDPAFMQSVKIGR